MDLNNCEQEGYEPPRRRFGSPPAAFSFDPSVWQGSPYSKPPNPNLPLAVHLLHIFAKMHRRRVVMESFMRIKLVYGLRMLQQKKQNSSFSSKDSSLNRSQRSKRGGSTILRELLDDSAGDMTGSRVKLLTSTLNKLQENSEKKQVAERLSSERQRLIAEEKVASKLESLQKMLEDIKKCNDQSISAPKTYASIRAKAKGKTFRESPEPSSKPNTTESKRQNESARKVQQHVAVHQFNAAKFASPSSPIEEKDEASDVVATVQPSESGGHAPPTSQAQKQKDRLTNEIKALTSELNDLRRINDSYIHKNTIILKQEHSPPLYGEDSKFHQTEQSTDSRIDPLKISSNIRHVLPQHSSREWRLQEVQPHIKHYQTVGHRHLHSHAAFRPVHLVASSMEKPTSRGGHVKPYTANHSQPHHTYSTLQPPKLNSTFYPPAQPHRQFMVVQTRALPHQSSGSRLQFCQPARDLSQEQHGPVRHPPPQETGRRSSGLASFHYRSF